VATTSTQVAQGTSAVVLVLLPLGNRFGPYAGATMHDDEVCTGPGGPEGGEGVPESAKTVVMGEFNVESGKRKRTKRKSRQGAEGSALAGVSVL